MCKQKIENAQAISKISWLGSINSLLSLIVQHKVSIFLTKRSANIINGSEFRSIWFNGYFGSWYVSIIYMYKSMLCQYRPLN